MKTNLLNEFNIKSKQPYRVSLTDYDIFPDKKLLDALRTKIVENLIDKDIAKEELTTEFINKEIDNTLEGYDLTNLERSHIFNLIDDEINGYGPLTEILNDQNISEIMVNSPNEIYIEINGQLIKDESVSFINNEHIIRTIQRLIEPLGRKIDAKNPMIDSRLMDGSRINALIPPLSVKGPIMTIHKFQKNMSTMDDLIRSGSLTPWMAVFLEAAIKAKLNIIICGKIGSGKTTLLNILSNFINEDERIITIEDVAELKLKQKHVISLETRNTNYEDETEVTIQDLVINSLRMRPDRIIVGEIKGKEVLDILQAMNNGHEGSLTTMHASNPKDALNRLETLMLMSNYKIPLKVLRKYIKSAIDIIINIEKLSDGKRKITSICEVDDIINDEIKLNEIFIFKQKGLTASKEIDGEYSVVNKNPKIYQKIKTQGINTLDDIFDNQIKNYTNISNILPTLKEK